ncbi:MAG: LysR family transcriptional regulator [Firmicutes bacterium]|nr:LysR family transcriptional regulator [Bacillota bacterium]
MEIRNLKTFLKVATLKNFTSAAKELGYSQANVSAQIKQLEQELDAPLFNRIGRKVTLTQYAEELLPYALNIVSTAVEMENLLHTDESLGGTVRVGMVESLFHAVGEDLIREYHRQFPRVTMDIVVDGTSVLKERLRQDTLDLALLIDDPLNADEWQIFCSARAKVVAVVNPSHPFAQRKKIKPEDISGRELVMMEDTAPYSIGFMNSMAKKHLDTKPFLTMQSADTAASMAEKDELIAVIPYYTAAQAIREGRLCALDIAGFDLTQDLQAVLHRDKVPVPQLRGFAGIFREMVETLER